MSVLDVKDAPSSRPPTYGGGTGLWATKSISALRAEAEATGERSLNRTLGAMNLTMLGIGGIIGAGIFVRTAAAWTALATAAAPASSC